VKPGAPLSVALAATLAAAVSPAAAGPPAMVPVETSVLRLSLSPESGRPALWRACHPSCDALRTAVTFNAPSDPPQLRLGAEGRSDLDARIARLVYRVDRGREDGAEVVRFTSEPLLGDVRLEKTYRIGPGGYRTSLRVALRGPGAEALARELGLTLRVVAGRAFEPPPAAGFAGLGAEVRSVEVGPDGARMLDPGADSEILPDGSWTGLRNRFWALLVRPEAPGARRAAEADGEVVAIGLGPPTDAGWNLDLYSGPVERVAVRAADPPLDHLLFAERWFWMRWLCFGLLFLLQGIRAGIGNAGLAIMTLALAVKVGMRPLSSLAERWQREVNEKRSRLQPHVDAIRKTYRGEQQAHRLAALYREQGVHPLFGLRSLFGVAVQIPVFIAAYHMLDENFALDGVGFLWVRNLAQPDRAAALPFSIPFFGDSLNLLPFAMTAVTLLSSRLHDDGSLAPDLLRRQRRGLYLMAGAFFALFYTFPAGMVLYWTSNNVVQLAREPLRRWRAERRARGRGTGEEARR
jgi:YidC/Oxa1 family membrane protein insertase